MDIWIWDTTTIDRLIAFLFLEQGILTMNVNEYRLFIFLGSFALLSVFFNFMELGGKEKSGQIFVYFLALVIAGKFASGENPLEGTPLIWMGMILFGFILGSRIITKEDFGENGNWFVTSIKIVFIIAIVMVVGTSLFKDQVGGIGGIFSVLTSYDDSNDEGWLAFLWTFISNLFGWWKYFVVLFLIICLFLIGKKGLKEKFGPYWVRFPIVGLNNKIINMARRIKYLGRFLEEHFPRYSRNEDFEGQMPEVLKNMKLELFQLTNFSLRHEIFKAKMKSTLEKKEKVGELSKKLELGEPNLNKALFRVVDYTHGRIPKGWIDITKPVEPEDTRENLEKPLNGPGWNRKKFIIYKLMYLLSQDLKDPTLESNQREKDGGGEPEKYTEKIKTDVIAKIETLFKNSSVNFRKCKKWSVVRTGAVNAINAQFLHFLDLYNVQGEYRRGLRFAREDAIPLRYTIEVLKRDDDDPTPRDMGEEELKAAKYSGIESAPIGFMHDNFRYEVDERGFFTKDFNDIKFSKGSGGKKIIKRIINPKDIALSPNPGEYATKVLAWSCDEWKWYLEDMFEGKFHIWSRTYSDYRNFVKKGKIENVPFDNPSGNIYDDNPTYDRDHLKDPTKFVYWGRKEYFDVKQEDGKNDGGNPYPYSSILGLWDYLQIVNDKLSGNKEIGRTVLRDFKAEYAPLKEITPTKDNE